MNTENKQKVVSIRMKAKDYEYLKIAAAMIGQTPSKLIRMLAASTISAVKVEISKGKIDIENFKAILND